MSINLKLPDIKELRPKITVFGVGGAGGNAVNNMIRSGLEGVDFVVANTDAQALMSSQAPRKIQLGVAVTEGLGAGSQPEIGRAAAEEVIDEITDQLNGAHMVFVTAGMGGGTGTGAAPVIARVARERGILTVGVVTKPFHFEGARRMRIADAGISDLQEHVDTLIVIPNQNLFRIANEKTTFADAFAMADQVLFSGVACITDLMVKEGLINLDFADVRAVMREMGKAMMGTGEASGERRAQQAAEAAIANPLLDETSMRGAKGLLISITGGRDLTLFEVDEAATRIREEVDSDANIILGATFDESLEGVIRVSVVATGIENEVQQAKVDHRVADIGQRPRPQVPPQPASPPSRASQEAARRIMPRGHAIPAGDLAAAHSAAAIAMVRSPIATQSASDPGVTIGPYSVSGADYAAGQELDPDPQAPADMQPDAGPFMPPAPEAAPSRMPRVEDLPPVVQRQLAPRAAEGAHGPMGLLKRLAQAGLGRRDTGDAASAPPAPRQAQARPAAPAAAPAVAHRPLAAPHVDYRPAQAVPHASVAHHPASRTAPAHRGAAGDLDPHGRQIPRDPRLDEGELEIPAFLRRQAN